MRKSVLRKHVDSVHDGMSAGVEFEMKVTDIFKDDPLGRQCMEGVRIRETQCDHCLNSKEEFRQPGELVAELPGADNRAGRRQQQGRQHRQQQQQQHEDVEGTSGGGDSAGGGPSQNTRSRVTSRNTEMSTQSTGYTISTRSRTRKEDNRNAV